MLSIILTGSLNDSNLEKFVKLCSPLKEDDADIIGSQPKSVAIYET